MDKKDGGNAQKESKDTKTLGGAFNLGYFQFWSLPCILVSDDPPPLHSTPSPI